jgi:hypothetical protein
MVIGTNQLVEQYIIIAGGIAALLNFEIKKYPLRVQQREFCAILDRKE